MTNEHEGRLFSSIPEAVCHHARDRGQVSIKLLHPSRVELSYEELWCQSGYYGAALARKGVLPRDRVALSMASTREVVITILALMRLGATLVPLYHRPVLRGGRHQDGASIVNALQASRARRCLVEERNLSFYQKLCAEAGMPVELLTVECLSEAMAPSNALVQRQFADDWPVILQFTAGSTSRPKGIYITQGNLVATVAGIGERIEAKSCDSVYSWLPLYHDFGLIGSLLCSLYAGTSVFLDSPYGFIKNPLSWIRGLSDTRATVATAPQFAFSLCLARCDVAWREVEDCDLSSLRLALNGAECVHVDSCRKFEEQFARIGLRPNVIQPCYGLAENCLAVTLRRPKTKLEVRHFCRTSLAGGTVHLFPTPTPEAITLAGNGIPTRGTEICIRSEDGGDLSSDQVGEIYVSGLAAAPWFADSDGNLYPSSKDGFLATGDLGAIVDGELYVLGRAKEILKRGGRTFIPADIERSLSALPLIWPNGVAAINVYDDVNGIEEFVVYVEVLRRLDTTTSESLANQIRLRILREFQVPLKDIIITRLGAIPRTTSGKIRRTPLRAAYLAGKGGPTDHHEADDPVPKKGEAALSDNFG
jgi:acyl-CoA synthetase (AMP-forming)/AMP-acid ligase II